MTREKYQVSYSTVLATVSAIILTTLVFIFKLNEKKTKSINSPQNKVSRKTFSPIFQNKELITFFYHKGNQKVFKKIVP